MPLWIALVNRLLGWPAYLFVLALVFKKPLSEFLQRLSTLNLKGGGLEISASDNATKQLAVENPAKSDPLAAPQTEQIALELPEAIENRQQLVRSYGGETPIVLEQINSIKTDLATLHFPLNSEETANILVRHLAVTQLIQRAEFLYRAIYGSQIALLRALNESGPQLQAFAHKFYNSARNRSPRFYVDYSFEQWVGFLINQRVVIMENETYALTAYGREFLGFITSQGLPGKTH